MSNSSSTSTSLVASRENNPIDYDIPIPQPLDLTQAPFSSEGNIDANSKRVPLEVGLEETTQAPLPLFIPPIPPLPEASPNLPVRVNDHSPLIPTELNLLPENASEVSKAEPTNSQQEQKPPESFLDIVNEPPQQPAFSLVSNDNLVYLGGSSSVASSPLPQIPLSPSKAPSSEAIRRSLLALGCDFVLDPQTGEFVAGDSRKHLLKQQSKNVVVGTLAPKSDIRRANRHRSKSTTTKKTRLLTEKRQGDVPLFTDSSTSVHPPPQVAKGVPLPELTLAAVWRNSPGERMPIFDEDARAPPRRASRQGGRQEGASSIFDRPTSEWEDPPRDSSGLPRTPPMDPSGGGGRKDAVGEKGLVSAPPPLPNPPASSYAPTLAGPVDTFRALYDLPQSPPPAGRAPLGFPSPSECFTESGSDRVLRVILHGASPLHADGSVVHPFVRVWLLNSASGTNLLTSELSTYCGITNPYDLRLRRSRSPRWEATITLHVDSEKLQSAGASAVLLFELLDCGSETLQGFYSPRNGLYPIAWGFRMLYDSYGRFEVDVRNANLQLFHFPTRLSWFARWVQFLLPRWWASAAMNAPSGNAFENEHADPSGRNRELITVGIGEDERVHVDEDDQALRNHLKGYCAASLIDADATRIANTPPAIFYIFKNPLHRKVGYTGGLVVSFTFTKSTAAVPPPSVSILPSEAYLLNLLIANGGHTTPLRANEQGSFDASDSTLSDPRFLRFSSPPSASFPPRRMLFEGGDIPSEQTPPLEPYRRLCGERALLPSTVLETAVVVGKVTCIAFSRKRSSVLLALGMKSSTPSGDEYVIELRDVCLPNLPVVSRVRGHTAHIHLVAFRGDDRLLLSCAADKTVCVYSLSDLLNSCSSLNTPAYRSAAAYCVLPHSFPINSAIFHHGFILTAGYSPKLLAWRYDQALNVDYDGESLYSGRSVGTLAYNTSFAGKFLASSHGFGVKGQLISETNLANGGLVLSLASCEMENKVWVVCSGDVVLCWHVSPEAGEQSDENKKGMRLWRRNICVGAFKVQVKGLYAIVSCSNSSVLYIFSTTDGELMSAVNTPLSIRTPICLLPDGNAFIAPAPKQGLWAWECKDGRLCTSPEGYDQIKLKFPIEEIAWADTHHLAAFRSTAPIPESCFPTHRALLQAFRAASSGSSCDTEAWIPAELTLIAIAGCPRSSQGAITASDPYASELFARLFGGSAITRQEMASHSRKLCEDHWDQTHPRDNSNLVSREKALLRSQTLRDGAMELPSDLDGLKYSDKGLQFKLIINFWKGLVKQHSHGKSGVFS